MLGAAGVTAKLSQDPRRAQDRGYHASPSSYPHLNKPADQRKALLRALTTALLREGRITTTKARAKAIRATTEKMITLAKEGSLAARRQALAYVYDKELVRSLFEQAPERYRDRAGGYTRILRTVRRRGTERKWRSSSWCEGIPCKAVALP